MAWTQERFTHEMRKFDRLLRLRKSSNGREYIIERKVRRESACRVKPNDRRQIDHFIADRDGYIHVMRVPVERLNHDVFLNLRAMDMWQYRGSGPFADALEAQERADEELKQRRDSTRLQDAGSEAYDLLRHKEGRIEAGFHSKVGGYEPERSVQAESPVPATPVGA